MRVESRSQRDCVITFHAPRFRDVADCQFVPKFFAQLLRVRQNHAQNFSAADQAVVPAEIVIEHQLECFRLAGLERGEREPLRLGFETAAAERAFDFAVGIKQRLRAKLLRAGTFHAGDDAERDRFAVARRGGEGLENRIGKRERLSGREKGGIDWTVHK